MRIILPFEFTPRPYQLASNRAYFIDKKLFSIEVLHRRAGKSKNALNFILGAAMQRVGNYYHTFPELTQARRAIWNGIDKEGKRYLDHIPKQLIKGNVNNTDMRINLINGSSIQLAGADRYDALMGGNPAGIVFDEYSLQNPFAWHYLSPIITENGGWAKFIYTPRGANWGYELYNRNLDNPNWFVQKLDITQTKNWDGTPIITEHQIEERRKEGMPEELIQQEFYVSFDSALAGSYFSKEISQAYVDNRIRNFDIDHTLPVYTAWDLGRRDPTSIWLFQIVKKEILMIGYYENVAQSMEHYIYWLGEFGRKNKIKFNMHFGPHDIKVTEYSTGKARIDTAASMGFYFTVVKKLPIMDGIDAVRRLFPRITFHKDNCSLGLDSLKQYHRNDKGEPVHDFASHPADALRTLAVGWYDSYGDEEKLKPFTMKQWIP
jgi:hypothetical protein